MKISFINFTKTKRDKNGIWITNTKMGNDVRLSHLAWEEIYDFDSRDLIDDLNDFKQNKLKCHMEYIEDGFKFSKKTVYLEIGCGPAHIGQYLMKKYGCHFIGVDFNYKILLTLKKYFDKKGFKKFTLIHSDINNMPLKPNSVDYIYGGGVIEHFSDTKHIIRKCFCILKKGGASFNTVPAFNFWWFTRFYNNIPSPSLFKSLFELIHLNILKGKVLQRYYGYELSFFPNQLITIHKDLGFKKVKVGPFAFYPSAKKLKNRFLRKLYYLLSKNVLLSPVLYVRANK